jgi:hypothetical protein
MMLPTLRVRLAGMLAVALALVLAAPGGAAVDGLSAPHAQGPTSTSATDIGALHWSAVGAADHYDFTIAADPAFNSPVLGNAGHFSTRNTQATLARLLPDGKYWWRVRAVSAAGAISGWSVSSVTKKWSAAPQLLAPANGASVSFPTQALLLSWRPVIGAVRYEVTIATDSALTSIVGGKRVATSAASLIPATSLAEGTYYWAVTPLDAEGHEGTQSAVRTFQWAWPSATTPTVRDLVDAPELFDPLLSWTPVAGAARYEVDVNFSQDFAPGSRVCCSTPTIATGFSPTKVLSNNTYYFRVRPVNLQGGQGVWTAGTPFIKPFDNVPQAGGAPNPSIGGLHMRDEFGDGGSKPAGWSTSAPILVWNPVPGASAYDVDIVWMGPTNSACDWTASGFNHWHVQTAVTAWTPLGAASATKPYPDKLGVGRDGAKLVNGTHYCARVRAIGDTDTAGTRVYGDYTYLNDAFAFNATAASGPVATPSAGDYLAPAGGAQASTTPLFTWRPIAGANGYWVIVSRDASFTTIVDYAFTNIPAYAPRSSSSPRTYADETTLYYWALLPAPAANGAGASGDPLHSSAASFQKRSEPPTLLSPAKDAVLTGTQPQFQWASVTGARNYRLQVSTDPNFGSKLLDNVVTPSTSYVSVTTYPAQATLYWRVQANTETAISLDWSQVGTFRQVLPAPTPSADGPTRSDSIPVWRWNSVPGAVAYDVRVVGPGGGNQLYRTLPTPALVPAQLTGTGVYRWQVRAEFSRNGSGTIPGAWSPLTAFTRTVLAPTGLRAVVNGRSLLFRWQPRPGIKAYHVEVSQRPDFARNLDTELAEGPAAAPTLSRWPSAPKGGKSTFYWRVAAVDADGNTGDFSPTKVFKFRPPLGR